MDPHSVCRKKKNQRLDQTNRKPSDGHDGSDNCQLLFAKAMNFPRNVLRTTTSKTCWCYSNQQIDNIDNKVFREAELNNVQKCPQNDGKTPDYITIGASSQ